MPEPTSGYVTAVCRATGHHRTFRVKRRLGGPGYVLSLVSGHGLADETDFAYLDGSRVEMLPSMTCAPWTLYVTIITEPEKYRSVEVKTNPRCRRCQRRLTSPESIRLGVGPTCKEKDRA